MCLAFVHQWLTLMLRSSEAIATYPIRQAAVYTIPRYELLASRRLDARCAARCVAHCD